MAKDKTFEWFTTADLCRYRDKYITIVGEEIVSTDEDPEIAYNIAKEKYPDAEVVLWKVPDEDIFVFCTSGDFLICKR